MCVYEYEYERRGCMHPRHATLAYYGGAGVGCVSYPRGRSATPVLDSRRRFYLTSASMVQCAGMRRWRVTLLTREKYAFHLRLSVPNDRIESGAWCRCRATLHVICCSSKTPKIIIIGKEIHKPLHKELKLKAGSNKQTKTNSGWCLLDKNCMLLIEL